MRHVFVETNWVFAYAAPAHRKNLNAVALLKRAGAGDLRLHLSSPCLIEARQAIRWKCQPREESEAVRSFLVRAIAEHTISREHDRIVRETLAKFERQMHSELSQLGEVIDGLLRRDALDVHSLNLSE